MDETFSFDDILLVPEYSDVEHGDINISSEFFNYGLKIPILSSPMDTISGKEMLNAMHLNGGFGIHHRYCDDWELVTIAGMVHGGIAISPSMGIDFVKSMYDLDKYNIFVMDVAHGDTKRNLDFCEELVKMGANVVSGNIVTDAAAMRYYNIGVKYLRVGIGAGSVCTTRAVTGVGYPQASAIMEIAALREEYTDIKIMSDGGHRTTGDIVKALALGSDFVMLGGMLAGTSESEGMTKGNGKQFGVYRGMASNGALSSRKKEFFVEGIEKEIAWKGSVSIVLKNIKDAIEQACYYTGSKNLTELRETTKVYISDGAKVESYVR